MPGRAKCEPGCTCEKHSRPRMSPEQEKARRNEISRAYYKANREKVAEAAKAKRRDPLAGEELRARQRERMANLSPEERERKAQLSRDWYSRNPRSSEESKRQHFKHRYGLTLEGRQQILNDQGGRCYLCGDPFDPNRPRGIHTDHDHDCCPGSRSCGKCIRGLACDGCNSGVGHFRDDPDRMRRAADALEAAKARVQVRSQPT